MTDQARIAEELAELQRWAVEHQRLVGHLEHDPIEATFQAFRASIDADPTDPDGWDVERDLRREYEQEHHLPYESRSTLPDRSSSGE